MKEGGKEKEKEKDKITENSQKETQLNETLEYKEQLEKNWKEKGEPIIELTKEQKEDVERLLWSTFRPYLPKRILSSLQPWKSKQHYSRFVLLEMAFFELFSSLNYDLERMKLTIKVGKWEPTRLDQETVTKEQIGVYLKAKKEIEQLGIKVEKLNLENCLQLKERGIKLITLKTINCAMSNWKKLEAGTRLSADLWREIVVGNVIEIREKE